jgi:hypothetical protein
VVPVKGDLPHNHFLLLALRSDKIVPQQERRDWRYGMKTRSW